MAYSLDYRQRVLALYEQGMQTSEVVEVMGCSASWARRLKQRFRQTGIVAVHQPQRVYARTYADADERRIALLIGQKPDATLREVVQAIGKPASLSTACRTLTRMDLPRKKKSNSASEQGRADVALARRKWPALLGRVRVRDLVFLDEFGSTTTMQRMYGRAVPGQRVVSYVPHGHWKTISTIAAMSSQGIMAAASFDGATDAATFVAFVRDQVVPQLKPSQVVIMDNLGCHRDPRVAQTIETSGARLLYLPPYSPDLNPIELAISKVKTLLRKLARRTVDGLFSAITEALESITASDAINYMLHRGYTLQ